MEQHDEEREFELRFYNGEGAKQVRLSPSKVVILIPLISPE